MKTLIIYELIPEHTRLYLVQPDAKQAALLHKIHGTYLNQVTAPEAEHLEVYDWLGTLTPIFSTEGEAFGNRPELMLQSGTLVIHTGQML